MFLARALGGLFCVLSLYYLGFYIVRQDPFTVVQMVMLLSAAAFLSLQERTERATTPWFRSLRPVSWQGWSAVVVGVTVAAAVFLVMDGGSHSASDTLNRSAPTYSLLIALGVRLWLGRSVAAAE